MAGKNQERATAQIMYVDQGKDGKEIAATLHVTEATVSGWVTKGKWKALREAKLNSLKQRTENIKQVISNLTEQRLDIDKERKDAMKSGDKELVYMLDKCAVGIADEISKWTKALASLDKDNRITLAIYLEVMDDVFKCMQAYDPKLFMQTIKFQQHQVQFASSKLG